MRAPHRGRQHVDARVGAELVIGLAEPIAGEDRSGRGLRMQAGLVTPRIRRVADDHSRDVQPGHARALDKIVRCVLGHEPADE